jgi:uncharacterized protein
MRKQVFVFLFFCTCKFANGQHKDYPIKSVEFTSVKLTDQFWLPRIRINHLITIPASFERCDKTGRINNFVMAAERKGKFGTLYPFDDTDIYKTIEGASYSLSLYPDAKLDAYIDSLIIIVGKAQEPDGYLYTARTIDPTHPHAWSGMNRWEREREMSHELYNSGHLYEAASAYYLATGKKSLLNIALKNADLVCSVFGPDKRHVAPGHEVVEMGLVKLYRITGKEEYLATAKYFVEERGHYKGYDSASRDPFKNGSYWQDDKPVIDQTETEGHAVRAGYLYSAMADVAALTGDAKLIHAIDTIWENFVSRKIYVQGGAGSVPDGERYGADYDLPNTTAYNETCAAIANIFWNQRMFLLHGDSKYVDVVEKIMYNGFISGLGLDGKSFFYTNAMQVKNSFSHESLETARSGWFPCSCCPTNIVRLLPSIPGYVYAQRNNELFVNLFISSESSIHILGKEIVLTQQNNYPWEGNLKFNIRASSPVSFSMKIRIPGWAMNSAIPSDLYSFEHTQATHIPITINGEAVEYTIENGYAVLNRKWNRNVLVEVKLPMEVKRVLANKKVVSDIGKVALQRGPVMFCAEGIDNDGRAANIVLPDKALFTSEFKSGLLNGVVVIKSNVPALSIDNEGQSIQTAMKPFTAIPYYAWANRGKGEMILWFPEKIKDIDILSSE